MVAKPRREPQPERFASEVAKRYQSEVGLTPAVYVCAAAAGASVEPA